MKKPWKAIVLILLVPSTLRAQQPDISKILWAANWSKDGKYIAVGGVDKKISIFSGLSFELIKVYDNGTAIQRMSWHPHSNLLAVAAVDSGSKLINVEKDTIILFPGDKGHGSRAIGWNHNGELLAIADYEGDISIRRKSGELLRTIKKENTISYVALDWHPQQNEIITLSEQVRVFDTSGNLLKTFRHRQEDVLLLCVRWHKTGDYFVIGDYGDNNKPYKPLLQFWSSKGVLKKETDISNAEYRNLSWSGDGKKLASASDVLRIWTNEGKLVAEGISEDKLWGVDWSPNGKYIVTSSHLGKIKIWDSNGKLVKELTN